MEEKTRTSPHKLRRSNRGSCPSNSSSRQCRTWWHCTWWHQRSTRRRSTMAAISRYASHLSCRRRTVCARACTTRSRRCTGATFVIIGATEKRHTRIAAHQKLFLGVSGQMPGRYLRLMPLVTVEAAGIWPVLMAACAVLAVSREVATSGVAAVGERLSHEIAVSITLTHPSLEQGVGMWRAPR